MGYVHNENEGGVGFLSLLVESVHLGLDAGDGLVGVDAPSGRTRGVV